MVVRSAQVRAQDDGAVLKHRNCLPTEPMPCRHYLTLSLFIMIIIIIIMMIIIVIVIVVMIIIILLIIVIVIVIVIVMKIIIIICPTRELAKHRACSCQR